MGYGSGAAVTAERWSVKRRGVLKPGVAFKGFWSELNYTDRRRWAGQRMLSRRTWLRVVNRALERMFTAEVVHAFVYRPNPIMGVLAGIKRRVQEQKPEPMFLTSGNAVKGSK